MVGILKLAADHNCKQQLGEFVLSSLNKAKIPCLGMLQNRYQPCAKLLPPPVQVTQHALQAYDHLLPSLTMTEAGHA